MKLGELLEHVFIKKDLEFHQKKSVGKHLFYGRNCFMFDPRNSLGPLWVLYGFLRIFYGFSRVFIAF